jgi:hypothetical protein
VIAQLLPADRDKVLHLVQTWRNAGVFRGLVQRLEDTLIDIQRPRQRPRTDPMYPVAAAAPYPPAVPAVSFPRPAAAEQWHGVGGPVPAVHAAPVASVAPVAPVVPRAAVPLAATIVYPSHSRYPDFRTPRLVGGGGQQRAPAPLPGVPRGAVGRPGASSTGGGASTSTSTSASAAASSAGAGAAVRAETPASATVAALYGSPHRCLTCGLRWKTEAEVRPRAVKCARVRARRHVCCSRARRDVVW